MPNGHVRWFSRIKGYGTITQDSGGDVCVPASAIKGGDRALEQGQRVQFDIVEGPKGPQAANVVKLHML